MKKVLVIAFIGSVLAVSCSKKNDHSLQDSNIMLEEPKAPTVVDSASAKPEETVVMPTPKPATTDSTAIK